MQMWQLRRPQLYSPAQIVPHELGFTAQPRLMAPGVSHPISLCRPVLPRMGPQAAMQGRTAERAVQHASTSATSGAPREAAATLQSSILASADEGSQQAGSQHAVPKAAQQATHMPAALVAARVIQEAEQPPTGHPDVGTAKPVTITGCSAEPSYADSQQKAGVPSTNTMQGNAAQMPAMHNMGDPAPGDNVQPQGGLM
jgi:hypothetical protein